MEIRIAVSMIVALMAFAAMGAPDVYPSAADERDEIQKTWRLLARDLAYWDTGVHDWRTDAGDYRLLVGAAADDIRAEATVSVGR